MARKRTDEEEILRAARERQRQESQQQKRGQSFFPAVNPTMPPDLARIAARNLNQAQTSINALNAVRNPVVGGGTIFDPRTSEGRYAAGYKASKNDLITYTLPSGGTVSIPSGSRAPSGAVAGDSARFNPPDLAAAYRRGYGAPEPTVQGDYLARGGVMTPLESLSRPERLKYMTEQQGRNLGPIQRFADVLSNNPALNVAGRAISGGASAIAGLFRKPGNYRPQYYSGEPSRQPIAMRPPRRYFDYD